MKPRLTLCLVASLMLHTLAAQTDAYIKLRDINKKYPRICSVTFPGDADNRQMYNSIYGHGAVIENPWVAYRVYMDNRQSLDLYAKQTPRLELETTGFYTTPQQLADGYGRDVLWAGKSIAAGSFRGWDGESPLTIDSVATRTQSVISPSCIEVVDKGWRVGGSVIDMTQRYTVRPDSPDLWVEVSLSGHDASQLFCTGIQKLETGNVGFILPEGVAASWGSNVPDRNIPDSPATVGLGIVVDPVNVHSVLETDLDYLVLLRPDAAGRIRYRVIATALPPGASAPAILWLDAVRAMTF